MTAAPRCASLWALASLLASGCPTPPPPEAASVPPPPVLTVLAPPVVPVVVAPHESPRLRDPRWLQARDPDPLEKARLAVAVGAAELAAALADGGETADTALAALPYADDADVALGRLAELTRAESTRRHRVLVAVLGIAGRPGRPREPLDPEGARRCGDAMLVLAADAALPREDRALALSAARALAERGYVDRARIPASLDR